MKSDPQTHKVNLVRALEPAEAHAYRSNKREHEFGSTAQALCAVHATVSALYCLFYALCVSALVRVGVVLHAQAARSVHVTGRAEQLGGLSQGATK